MEERIRARLKGLMASRAAYQTETDRTLAGYDAAIGELRALLLPDPDEQPPQPAPQQPQQGETA